MAFGRGTAPAKLFVARRDTKMVNWEDRESILIVLLVAVVGELVMNDTKCESLTRRRR